MSNIFIVMELSDCSDSWDFVNIAAFSSRENAEKYLEKVKRSGYEYSIDEIPLDDNTIYNLFKIEINLRDNKITNISNIGCGYSAISSIGLDTRAIVSALSKEEAEEMVRQAFKEKFNISLK